MSNNLNIGNWELHKDDIIKDILKAEIVSLFSLLGKTFTEWWKGKGFFKTCSATSGGSAEIPDLLKPSFENVEFNFQVKYGTKLASKLNAWDNFLNDKWRSWRSIKLKDNPDKFLQVLYGSCEGINSGIEKGSPSENNQISKFSDKPFLSTSFGKVEKRIEDKDLNELRKVLFSGNLNNELDDDLKKFIKNRKILNQNISTMLGELTNDNISIWKLISLRIRIYNLIYLLYKNIPSDSRFPANDTSLFDQAYMSTSLFKATLAGMFLSSNGAIDISNFDGSKIKWSILGIQYDKLGLAEKGLKAASIKWYRDTSKRVNNEIKKLIEVEYSLGNEVYRDETGIYFVVAENIKGEKEGDFYKLHNDLSSIKAKIQEIFTNTDIDHFAGEIYPAIFLTEPSRGLMNLGHLVEEARKNFLKAEIPGNFKNYLKDDLNPNGICQICGMRLAHKDNKENLICNVCLKRQKDRIDNWFKHLKEETIWTDELQDKNGRIALITLKFELDKWTNGDLVNSLLVRQEKYNEMFCKLKNLLDESRKFSVENHQSYYQQNRNYFIDFLSLFDSSIQSVFKKLINNLNDILNKSYKNIEHEINKIQYAIKGNLSKNQKRKLERKLQNLNLLYSLKNTLKNYLYDGRFSLDLKYNSDGCFKILNSKSQNDIKNQVAFVYLYILISNLVLERSIGNEWKNFIKSNLSDPNVIDFDKRKIEWDKLADQDIEFLTSLILQFLLRKNPSPARLRRIWETTRNFFEDLESRITELAGIPEERQKRLVWNNIDIEDGEYQDDDILFWAKDKTVYLISSIEALEKNKFDLRKYNSNKNKVTISLDKNQATEQIYKPYFTILPPTPISWQFIIPAEYVPNLIKNIQEEYYKNFKWVYGKLPLHIGIVVQNYKRPLYVGIKALRRIRRDKQKWKYLGKDIPAKDFKARQKKAFHYQQNPEQVADCENFYSLFERADGNQKRYDFYLYPHKSRVWIDTTQDASDTDKFYFYRNTFDFEFLDTNVRRNDIFYKKAKRTMTYKQNRPYDIEDWQYFEQFRQYFKDKKTSSKLHKLVSLIYSKLEDWKDDPDAIKTFMLSAFINILELNQGNRDIFAGILGLKDWDEFKNLEKDKFIKKLYMFLDMFEFWHTTLKEV